MSQRKTSQTALADYESEHRHLADRLSKIGFLWAGSINRRYLKCGNPRCACRKDPEARHGPYTYWSTKKAGKTVSRKLSVDEAKVLEQWVANRQEVKTIVDRMMTVSQQAFELVLKNTKDRKTP
jgi:hypothetical protein